MRGFRGLKAATDLVTPEALKKKMRIACSSNSRTLRVHCIAKAKEECGVNASLPSSMGHAEHMDPRAEVVKKDITANPETYQ
jgi:hypothetical protein